MSQERICLYCKTKMPRGSYLTRSKRGVIEGYYCKSEIDCFNRILKQRDDLLTIGNQMSNVMYNLSQRSAQFPLSDLQLFRELYNLWAATKTPVR